jgi:uncharacterized membrane protein
MNMRKRVLGSITTVALLGLAGCESDPGPVAPRATDQAAAILGSAQATYEFRAFDVPAEMGAFTSAFGNNNAGTIVGNYGAPDETVHGFIFRSGKFIDVTVPGANSFDRGSLLDINDAGIAVGSYLDEFDVSRTFIRAANGTITVLPLREPDALTTEGYGINNRGTIVGNFFDSDGVRHGFIWRMGAFTTFDPPGSISTRLNGVNNLDEVAGQYLDASRLVHGFILRGGEVEEVAYPGAVSTRASSINDRGEITGFYNNADGVWHGYLYSDGQFTSMDFPGSFNTIASGINDRGEFVGTYDDFSRGFVATVVR